MKLLLWMFAVLDCFVQLEVVDVKLSSLIAVHYGRYRTYVRRVDPYVIDDRLEMNHS